MSEFFKIPSISCLSVRTYFIFKLNFIKVIIHALNCFNSLNFEKFYATEHGQMNTLFAVLKQVNLGVFPHGPPTPPSLYSHDDQLLYSISHLSSCPGLSLFTSTILSLVFEGQKVFHMS